MPLSYSGIVCCMNTLSLERDIETVHLLGLHRSELSIYSSLLASVVAKNVEPTVLGGSISHLNSALFTSHTRYIWHLQGHHYPTKTFRTRSTVM
jgi:hypothetical protein